MEQFRHIGEVFGSLKALMLLQDDIQINKRQCCLLLDIFNLAFDTIAAEIKQNLKLEERNTKWKPLEEPLRELYRVFKEGEIYVRRCLDNKDWWGKVISLHQNKDSVEFHIHNLLCCFPVVIESIEIAGEISGLDPREMHKRRVLLAKKYDKCWNDQELFLWRFGKQYLVDREICNHIESSVREDRWLLAEAIKQKKRTGAIAKSEHRLADVLLKKLNGTDQANGKLLSSAILLGSEDYQVKRRLGGGNQYKEIHWLGESFVLRHFFGDIEPLSSEISTLLSLSHPNIVQYFCGFYDEEKKECFLVMELTAKDLYSYLKENSSLRRRAILPLPVVIDIMLQVARGMEYLHARKIYVGDLNPTNIYLKPRKSMEGYFYVKVSGFGLKSVENSPSKHSSLNQNTLEPNIWYAPEVLAEQEQQQGSTSTSISTCKYTEKADVYCFGMLCFELLTGKLPFKDSHLQGEQMIKNIRAGERPLFPFISPKYLVNLTKRCWHTDPVYRPSFSSICRTLRYVKKFLLMNPDVGQPEMQAPPVDFYNLEARFLKKHPTEQQSSSDLSSVLQIPFQMFAYTLVEQEKFHSDLKNPEIASEAALNSSDGNNSIVEDPIIIATDVMSVNIGDAKIGCFDLKSIGNEDLDRKKPSDLRSVCSEPPEKKVIYIKKTSSVKIGRPAGKLNKAATPPRPTAAWHPKENGSKPMRRDSLSPLSISCSSPSKRRPSS